MKKIAVLLTLLFTLGLLSACSASAEPGDTLQLQSDKGKLVQMGQSEEEIRKVLDGGFHIIEFEEDSIERHQSLTYDGVFVDYYDETAVALRLEYVTTELEPLEWYALIPMADGALQKISLGDAQDAVRQLYGDLHTFGLTSTKGEDVGFMVSYDEDFRPVDFSADSPYAVQVRCHEGLVYMLILEDNR